MGPAVELGEAVDEDLPGIASVHVRSWQVAYRGLIPDEVLNSLDVDRRRANWESFIDATEGLRLVVARAGGEVVGFASAGPCRDDDADGTTGELYAIYVEPSRWGEGIGTQLLQDVEDRLVADGWQAATLWVLKGNARSRAFYEACGWREDGATKVDDRGEFVLEEIRYRRLLPGQS